MTKKTKDLYIVNYLQKKGMVFTNTELKILYKVNEFKEGITLTNLSKELNKDIGNLSKSVNILISKGALNEIGRNPKIIKIGNPRFLTKINLIKCLKCNSVYLVSSDYKIYKCRKCKIDIFINNKTKMGEIKEDTIKKLNSLCYSLNVLNYDDLADKLLSFVSKIQK